MVFIDVPLLAIYIYVILLNCGLGVSVSNAATVNLYPTNLRYIIRYCIGSFDMLLCAQYQFYLIVTGQCRSPFSY